MCGEATAGNGSGAMAIQRRRDERGEAASEHGLGRAVTGEEGRGGGRVLTGVLQGFGQWGDEEVDRDDRRGRRRRG